MNDGSSFPPTGRAWCLEDVGMKQIDFEAFSNERRTIVSPYWPRMVFWRRDCAWWFEDIEMKQIDFGVSSNEWRTIVSPYWSRMVVWKRWNEANRFWCSFKWMTDHNFPLLTAHGVLKTLKWGKSILKHFQMNDGPQFPPHGVLKPLKWRKLILKHFQMNDGP